MRRVAGSNTVADVQGEIHLQGVCSAPHVSAGTCLARGDGILVAEDPRGDRGGGGVPLWVELVFCAIVVRGLLVGVVLGEVGGSRKLSIRASGTKRLRDRAPVNCYEFIEP
jgi:hypothetical protein